MKLFKIVLLAVVVVSLMKSCAAIAADKIPLPVLPDSLKAELAEYLQKHWQSPEDYVVSKFKDHDIVILGEQHRARQDPLLIQRLIPLVYKAGVYNLGFEFARRVDQPLIDSLLNGKEYDQLLANEILLRGFVHWCYQEYSDIFKAAWQLNQQLPAGKMKFRILGVNDSPDWSLVKIEADQDNREIRRKVWHGETEQDWADYLLRETTTKGEKSLVYCGIHHAFTGYHQPLSKNGKFVGFAAEPRFGNFLRDSIGQRVMTIYMHNYWSTPDWQGYTYPAGGYIDALMATFDSTKWRVGFDTKGTPFEKLPDKSSYYALGYDSFGLGNFCDGYIFQMPFSRFESITCIPNYYTGKNIDYARRNAMNPWFRNQTIKAFEETCDQERRENAARWEKLY
jgi:hypothetical protein